MRRLRHPSRPANASLRLAIRRAATHPNQPVPADRKPALGASLLVGSMLLAIAPAGQALTLGEINVRSALGQPLNATVPVRVGAGEALASACVVPGQKTSDLRRVPGARVSTPETAREGLYELRVTSDSALYEPMYELELRVQCPGAPVVVRQYVLMLDLPGAVASSAPLAKAPAPALTTVRPTDRRPEAPPQVSAARDTPRATTIRPSSALALGSTYRVAQGDTLSSIAARVRDRNVSLWSMADAIQAANPDAFIRNDANLIKLGSEIRIPGNAMAPAPASVAANPVAAPQAMESLAATLPAPVDAAALPVAVPVALPVAIQEPIVPASLDAVAAPARPVAAQPEPTAPAATEVVADAASEPNPLLAAGAGILFGLFISAILWFRGRLPSRKRPAAKRETVGESRSNPPPEALSTVVQPLVTRAVEPGFTVSYSAQYDDSLADEFAADLKPAPVTTKASTTKPAAPQASEEITTALEELFDSTDTTIQKRLDAGKTMAALSLANARDDEYAPPPLEPGADIDFQIGGADGDDDATMAARTVDQPRQDLSPPVDIHALAASATKDQQQAQTLLEALTLLERDYEEELTASQVLDMSAVRKALDAGHNEPTQISAARARKKAR